MSRPVELPRWMDIGLLPLVNLAMALVVCAIVVAVVGLDPLQVLTLLVKGAFGSRSGIGYTLYYATTFVFTGLAVAVAIRDGFGRDAVLYEVREALRRLLWPLPPGGPDATGWPLGRVVRERELEVEISRVPGVREVDGLNLFERNTSGDTGGAGWQLLPRSAADAAQSLDMQAWQLPELLSIVVVDDSTGVPTSLAALPNPFAQANAVAVPVVPALC